MGDFRPILRFFIIPTAHARDSVIPDMHVVDPLHAARDSVIPDMHVVDHAHSLHVADAARDSVIPDMHVVDHAHALHVATAMPDLHRAGTTCPILVSTTCR